MRQIIARLGAPMVERETDPRPVSPRTPMTQTSTTMPAVSWRPLRADEPWGEVLARFAPQ